MKVTVTVHINGLGPKEAGKAWYSNNCRYTHSTCHIVAAAAAAAVDVVCCWGPCCHYGMKST